MIRNLCNAGYNLANSNALGLQLNLGEKFFEDIVSTAVWFVWIGVDQVCPRPANAAPLAPRTKPEKKRKFHKQIFGQGKLTFQSKKAK